ncbi:MAG: VCBS domain-containing protein, partial [Pseudomonadota bacterium]
GFTLPTKDVLTAGASEWEQTEKGNWMRINNGKIDFALGTPGVDGPSGISINSLGADDVVDDTFSLSIRLGNGTLSEARVSVKINGSNDAAAIIVNSNDGDVTEAGVVANATVGDPAAGGQLTVVDLDAGENAFQEVALDDLVGDYGTFTFNAATGAWTYLLNNDNPDVEALNIGDALTDSFTVTSLDGTASQPITVTINGSNDAPVISGTVTGAAQEDTTFSATGTLIATDVDAGATATWAVQSPTSKTYGSLAVDGETGKWTYTLNNGTNGTEGATQSLAAGESHEETFIVRATDEQGAYADQ